MDENGPCIADYLAIEHGGFPSLLLDWLGIGLSKYCKYYPLEIKQDTSAKLGNFSGTERLMFLLGTFPHDMGNGDVPVPSWMEGKPTGFPKVGARTWNRRDCKVSSLRCYRDSCRFSIVSLCFTIVWLGELVLLHLVSAVDVVVCVLVVILLVLCYGFNVSGFPACWPRSFWGFEVRLRTSSQKRIRPATPMGHPLSVGPWAGSLEIDRQSTIFCQKPGKSLFVVGHCGADCSFLWLTLW